MSFALASQRITGNSSYTFQFGSKIGCFVYGLQRFSLVPAGLRMPGDRLPDFGLSYTVTSGSGRGFSEVEIIQHIGDGLDPTTSADVTVLAYLGGAQPSDIILGNQAMPMGASGQPTTPAIPPVVGCAVLGGFTSSFTGGATELIGIGAGAGIACLPGSSDVAPVGFGALVGNAGFSGSVDAGLVLLGPSTKDEISATALGFTAPTNSFTTKPGISVTSCAVLIQSFYTQFFASEKTINSFLDWNSLTVEASGAPSPDKKTVGGHVNYTCNGTTITPGGYMSPPSESPARVESTVGTVLVVGIP